MASDKKNLSKKRKILRFLSIFLILLLIGYIIGCVLFYFYQDEYLYAPSNNIHSDPSQIGLSYENVTFNTSDGKSLSGWFVPSNNSSFHIIYCHGYSGNIADKLESIRLLHQLNLTVFIFDYRGYGLSEGEPSEKGTYKDVNAAWNFLVLERNISEEQIMIYGRSLGGPIAAWLAKEQNPAGLILESTFTSYNEIAGDLIPILPVSLLSRFDYDTIGYVKKVVCPVMVIHSKDDDQISYSHGRSLYRYANEPKDFLEISGTHADCYSVSDDKYLNGIDNFIEEHIEK